ncbi:MAG: hypothetical protein K2Y14_00420 [Burkholderiales bacterium]|nr:hypothetical protein [Burkholderiales bacterium]
MKIPTKISNVEINADNINISNALTINSLFSIGVTVATLVTLSEMIGICLLGAMRSPNVVLTLILNWNTGAKLFPIRILLKITL